METHLRAAEHQLPYGITQDYLTPDIGERTSRVLALGQARQDVDVVERFAGAGLSLFARLLTNVIAIYFT